MGGVIHGPTGNKLTLQVAASKDPESAALDLIQVIKGYLRDGKVDERIYNAARAPSRAGCVELKTEWRDPDFREDEPA
jgi:hypothetical protein